MSTKLEKVKGNVKILKRCEETVEESRSEVTCNSFELSGNFLDTVDNDILFVDSSLDEEKVSKEGVEGSLPSISFENIPRKLDDQISLPLKDISDLSFYETFVISEGTLCDSRVTIDILRNPESLIECGSACVMVEEHTDGNIFVFTTHQTLVGDERVCCECVSLVSKDLRLIHEKMIVRRWTEYTFTEKSLFILSTDTGYRLVKTQTEDDSTNQFGADIEWTKSGDFLSHGANVLLIRRLVMKKFTGCIQSYICDIDGDFALCQHYFHKARMQLVNDRITLTKQIDQVSIFERENVIKNTSYHDCDSGRMLKEYASDQNFFIHFNPLTPQARYTKDLQQNWEKDVELMAEYLRSKAKRRIELKQKFESPHVRLVLRNYFHTLIKSKPQNVMNFTVEFIRKLEQSSDVNVQRQILETADRRHQQN